MNSFDEIVGHEQVVSHMKNAYKMNKVSHAYILEGEEGMGKKSLVNCFVKLLQCEKPTGDKPCNSCSSCVQMDSGNHPDIIYVQPTKKTGYGVMDIREQIISDIHIKPYRSRYKVYIIEQADTMTEQAQNSILKTIEEPPEYGLFFLLANNSKRFLQTILSRAVKMTLKPISLSLIETYLCEQKGLSHQEAMVYSSFSRGNFGKALVLKDSEDFNQQRKNMLKLLDIFINHKEYDIMNAVRLLEEAKESIASVLDILISLIRDILLVLETGSSEGIIHKDLEGKITKLSENANPKKLLKLVENCYTLISQMRFNVNYSLSTLVLLTDV